MRNQTDLSDERKSDIGDPIRILNILVEPFTPKPDSPVNPKPHNPFYQKKCGSLVSDHSTMENGALILPVKSMIYTFTEFCGLHKSTKKTEYHIYFSKLYIHYNTFSIEIQTHEDTSWER